MAANTATLLPDFPISIGNRRLSVITLTGPSSYTAVTPSTPPAAPTGGQALLATQFGLKYIETVYSCLSDDGQYTVAFTPKSATKNGVTDGILIWITASGGSEPTGGANLSGVTIRLTAIGR